MAKTLRTHMPPMASGFVVLRILQLLGALAIFSVSLWFMVNWLSLEGVVAISVSTATIIILIWELCAENCAPRAYNYWAVLTFEVLLFINWIHSLAWFIIGACVYSTSDYYSFGTCDYSYYSDYSDSYTSDCEARRMVATLEYAGAGLTGCMFVLYLTSLIIVGSAITKHRNAGGRNQIGSAPPAQAVYLPPQPYPNYAGPVYAQPQAPQNVYVPYQQQDSVRNTHLEQQHASLQQQYTQLQQQHLALQRQSQIDGTSSISRTGSPLMDYSPDKLNTVVRSHPGT